MSSRDGNVRKMQAKLEEGTSDVDRLMAKANEASADIRSEYSEQIEALVHS